MLAHVADYEPVVFGRMQIALSSPGSQVPNWDEDGVAIAKNYSAWDVETSLAAFAVERSKTVEFYESLTDDQTRLTVKHPILGELSIFDIAVVTLGHDAYHVEQLSQSLSR